MKTLLFLCLSFTPMALWASPLQSVEKTLNQCRQIIEMKDRDVKDRQIEKNISEAWGGCKEQEIKINEAGLEKLNQEMKAIAKHINVEELSNDLNAVALKQTALALWGSYKAYVTPSPLNETQAKALLCDTPKTAELCKESKSGKIIKEAFLEFQKREAQVPYHNKEKTLQHLNTFNERLQTMKELCSEIAMRKMDSSFRSSPEISLEKLRQRREEKAKRAANSKFSPSDLVLPSFPKSQAEADAMWDKESLLLRTNKPLLQSLYSEMLMSPYGALLVTETMRKTTKFNPVDFSKRNPCETISSFSVATPSSVQKSKLEFRSLIKNELLDIYENDETIKSDASRARKVSIIKDYLKTSPDTVAELLAKNPNNSEYAKALCSFIQDIYTSDYRMKIVDNVVMGVSTVTSLALMCTGVGSPLGVGLMSVSMATSAYTAGKGVYNVVDGKKMKDDFSEASAAGEMTNLDLAIRSMDKMDTQVWVGSKDIILGTLGVLSGYAQLKDAPTLLEKILQSTHAKMFQNLKSEDILGAISKGLNTFYFFYKDHPPAFFSKLSSDDAVAIGYIYSQLPPEDGKQLYASLSSMKSPEEVKAFLRRVDENAQGDKEIFSYTKLEKLTK